MVSFSELLESETCVCSWLKQGLELDDATKLRVKLNVFWVFATIHNVFDDKVPVEDDYKFFGEVKQICVNEVVDDDPSRSNILPRVVVPHQEVDVLLAFLLVKTVLRIVIALLVLFVNQFT